MVASSVFALMFIFILSASISKVKPCRHNHHVSCVRHPTEKLINELFLHKNMTYTIKNDYFNANVT